MQVTAVFPANKNAPHDTWEALIFKEKIDFRYSLLFILH